MKTKRSTECAVLMGLGACHGCASGSKLAFHEDFAHKFIAYGFFAEDSRLLMVGRRDRDPEKCHFKSRPAML
jgi:hypothetical protein